MKVPDSLVSTEGQGLSSIGSEGQTTFGMDHRLFADKPILSLVEQRIKAVADYTRQQIAARNVRL